MTNNSADLMRTLKGSCADYITEYLQEDFFHRSTVRRFSIGMMMEGDISTAILKK
jgi:hypothetical protein